MLTTKKVIEDAIRVREDEIKKLEIKIDEDYTSVDWVFDQDIKNIRSQIAELKQSLQIIYDANRL